MFDTCEGRVKFFGAIASVCGDNPGSAAVAGFKESSSAFRCCRQCLATKEQMMTKVSEIPVSDCNAINNLHHLCNSFMRSILNYETLSVIHTIVNCYGILIYLSTILSPMA